MGGKNACSLSDVTDQISEHSGEREGQELWYIPMFRSDVCQWRKIFNSFWKTGGTVTTEKTVEKEHFYMFFDIDEKEAHHGN